MTYQQLFCNVLPSAVWMAAERNLNERNSEESPTVKRYRHQSIDTPDSDHERNRIVGSILLWMFDWDETPEGDDYWSDLYNWLLGRSEPGSPMPELPQRITFTAEPCKPIPLRRAGQRLFDFT